MQKMLKAADFPFAQAGAVHGMMGRAFVTTMMMTIITRKRGGSG